jgi:hypothetical protein
MANAAPPLYVFYYDYTWSHDDFDGWQTSVVGMLRDTLGALAGPAVLSGGTVTPGSGLSISVAAFVAIGDDGYLHVKTGATSNVALAAAHATLARKDLIVARKNIVDGTTITRPTAPYDTVPLTKLQKTQVVVITGTPGASPAYPAKTAGDVVLGGVNVPATATTVSTGNIDSTVKETTLGNQNFSNYYAHASELAMFGDYSDGDLTISSGTVTPTRDMYYDRVVINGTGKLQLSNEVKILGRTLDLTNAPANAITVTPSNGANGVAQDNLGAAAGASIAAGTLGGSAGAAGSGANGSAGISAGSQAAAVTAGKGNGGASGAGGAGGPEFVGHAGGASRAGVAPVLAPMRRITFDLLSGLTLIGGGQGGPGGSGGGSGNDGVGGGGGGGGPGGGVGLISFKEVIVASSTAAGAISLPGGNGGNGAAGGDAFSGTGGGGGGGGAGGGGGWLQAIFGKITGSKTGVISCPGGNGGNGGNGGGGVGGNHGGGGGNGGDGGSGGRAVVFNLETGAVTVTVGSSGTTGTAGGAIPAPPGFGAGGAGGAGGACSANL